MEMVVVLILVVESYDGVFIYGGCGLYSKSKIGKNLKSSRTNHIGKGGELGVFLSLYIQYNIFCVKLCLYS